MEPQNYKQKNYLIMIPIKMIRNNRISWCWFWSKIDPKHTLFPVWDKFRSEKYLIMIQVTVQATITYLCWFWHQHQQQQQKIEEKYMEEMLLPRILKIKFGEEYSRVYTILLYMYCYSMTMQRKSYKMISNKSNVLQQESHVMFEKYRQILMF